MHEWKTKDVHLRGASNLNIGLFVCSFDVYRDSQPVPSINYVLINQPKVNDSNNNKEKNIP